MQRVDIRERIRLRIRSRRLDSVAVALRVENRKILLIFPRDFVDCERCSSDHNYQDVRHENKNIVVIFTT